VRYFSNKNDADTGLDKSSELKDVWTWVPPKERRKVDLIKNNFVIPVIPG
jgi:hypothetical protein